MTTIVTIRAGSKPVTVESFDKNYGHIKQYVVRPETSFELTLHSTQPILTVTEVLDEHVPSLNFFTDNELRDEMVRRSKELAGRSKSAA